MVKSQIPPCEALFPVPVVLVSCVDKDKNGANAITIAWCGMVASVPPHISVSIRPSRYSHKLITREKSFVVNIPSEEILKQVDLCGTKSGKDTDKFSLCSFTSIPSTKIESPMIGQCPVNIECKLKETIRLGTHDVFMGEVLAVHVDKDLLNAEGKIDFAKAKPIAYNMREYWNLGKKIGYYGFSQK